MMQFCWRQCVKTRISLRRMDTWSEPIGTPESAMVVEDDLVVLERLEAELAAIDADLQSLNAAQPNG